MSRCISICSLLAGKAEPGVSRPIRTMNEIGVKNRTKRIGYPLLGSLYSESPLLPNGELSTAFPLPATFVAFGTHRALLTVADGFKFVPWHTEPNEKIARGCGAPVAQTQVVFGRTTLIAVSFHHDNRARKIVENALQRFGVGRESVARVAADVVRIVIKERVLQIREDAIFQCPDAAGCARIDGLPWRRRGGDGNGRGAGHISGGAGGRQRVGDGAVRRHALGSRQ